MFDYIIRDFECYLSSTNIALIKKMFVENEPSIINLKALYGKYCLSFKLSKKFYDDPITYINNNSLEKFEYYNKNRHDSQNILLAMYLNFDEGDNGETASFKMDAVSHAFENKQKEIYRTLYDMSVSEKTNNKQIVRIRNNPHRALTFLFENVFALFK